MATIDGLPPLRDVIADEGLSAKKALGQNFLLDLNLTAKIARQAGDLGACDVLEIGPGPGGLTRALLHEGARKVLAIEKDARCLPALARIAEHYPNRLQIIEGDALQIDPRQHLNTPIRVVANLPYNIGTELLIRWLTPKCWPPFWDSLTLMFQKEVAARIVATPGTKAYGRLAILTQWRAKARIVMEISPQAFTPPPKVTHQRWCILKSATKCCLRLTRKSSPVWLPSVLGSGERCCAPASNPFTRIFRILCSQSELPPQNGPKTCLSSSFANSPAQLKADYTPNYSAA